MKLSERDKEIRLLERLARYGAQDEADRNMRKDGRKAWNADDYNIAVRTYNKLVTDANGCKRMNSK